MKMMLLVMLALAAPLVAMPTATATDHCDELPYHTEIICRVWAAADELLPLDRPTLP